MNPIATIEVGGFNFLIETLPDDSADLPWEQSDCHGPVRRARTGNTFSYYAPVGKRPGERALYAEANSGALLYDWQEAIRIAKREGWGLSDERTAELAAQLGRKPTAREVRAESVRLDFKRLKDYCDDRWHYVDVRATLLDADGEAVEDVRGYIGGVESDCEDSYFIEVGTDAAWQALSEVQDHITGRVLNLSVGARTFTINL